MDEQTRAAYEAGWAEMTRRCSQATEGQIAQMARELEARGAAAAQQGVDQAAQARLDGERAAVEAFVRGQG